MPIETFTREQFEQALPQGSNGSKLTINQGVTDGEYAYRLPVVARHHSIVYIAIRSSVRENGISAGVGEDSIRLYLMSPTGPVAGKLTKYITRTKGWDKRMVNQLRILYKLALSLKPCPVCGDLRHAFKAGRGKGSVAKPENVGRMFQKCVRKNARGKGQDGCESSFEWIG